MKEWREKFALSKRVTGAIHYLWKRDSLFLIVFCFKFEKKIWSWSKDSSSLIFLTCSNALESKNSRCRHGLKTTERQVNATKSKKSWTGKNVNFFFIPKLAKCLNSNALFPKFWTIKWRLSLWAFVKLSRVHSSLKQKLKNYWKRIY